MKKHTPCEKQNTSIVIVLGYKNHPDGTLHPISQQRARKAFEVTQECTSQQTPVKLLCTGGFGRHFNQNINSHGLLVQKYLEKMGLKKQLFLPIIASQNTYEDGKLCAEQLSNESVNELILVTSDFHIQRGFLWLNHFCPQLSITCAPAKTKTNDIELKKLLAHEKQAIDIFYHDFPNTQNLEQLYDWDSLCPPI